MGESNLIRGKFGQRSETPRVESDEPTTTEELVAHTESAEGKIAGRIGRSAPSTEGPVDEQQNDATDDRRDVQSLSRRLRENRAEGTSANLLMIKRILETQVGVTNPETYRSYMNSLSSWTPSELREAVRNATEAGVQSKPSYYKALYETARTQVGFGAGLSDLLLDRLSDPQQRFRDRFSRTHSQRGDRKPDNSNSGGDVVNLFGDR